MPQIQSPEQAQEVAKWVADNPDDHEMVSALDAYQARQSIQRPPDVLPPKELRPHGLAGFFSLHPLGGVVQKWQEPSDAEFQQVAGAIPDGVDPVQLKKDYADARWAQAHDHAKATGRYIQRLGGTNDMDPSERFMAHQADPIQGRVDALENQTGLRHGIGLLSKFDGGILGSSSLLRMGLPPDQAAEAQKSEDSLGGAEGTAASIAGSLMPGSVPGLMGKAVGLGKPVSGAIAGALSGIGKGALTGEAIGAADDLSRAIEDGFSEKPKATALEHLAGHIGSIPTRMGVGGLLGAIPGALGGNSARLVDPNIAGEEGGLFANAKEAGVTTSLREGLSLPEYAKVGEGHAVPWTPKQGVMDNLADYAAPFVAKGGAETFAAKNAPWVNTIERYHAVVGKKSTLMPLVKSAFQSIEDRSLSGADLAASEGNGALPSMGTEQAKRILAQSSRHEIIPEGAQHGIDQNKEMLIPLRDAIKYGIVSDGKMLPGAKAPLAGDATVPGIPGGIIQPPGSTTMNVRDSELLAAPPPLPGAQLASAPSPPPEATIPAAPPAPMGPPPPGPMMRKFMQSTIPEGPPGQAMQPGAADLYRQVVGGLNGTPPAPAAPTKLADAMKSTDFNPDKYWVVFKPHNVTPKEGSTVLSSVDDMVRAAEKNRETAHGLAPLIKATREVRDTFPDPNRFGVKADTTPVTIQDPLTGESQTLRGWSAFMHRYKEHVDAMENVSSVMGLPSARFDPNDPNVLRTLSTKLRGVGASQPWDTTNTLRNMARTGGNEDAVKGLVARNLIRGPAAEQSTLPGGINELRIMGQLGRTMKYRLDPAGQAAQKAGPAMAGILNAADPLTRALFGLQSKLQESVHERP